MDRIGKYRHRVTIKNPPLDSARDGFGRRKGTGTTVATLWAQKEDWSGDETAENGRETASVTTKFRIRYRTDLAPKMTLTHGVVVYNILSIMDFDGTMRELLLTCRKVVDS
jgi:SPP1 family predicted phage head-tail adaptor